MVNRTPDEGRSPRRTSLPEVRVRRMTVVAVRKAARLKEGLWNVVLTTAGGTFLIRGPKGAAATSCPLRAFEVRRIDEADSEALKRPGDRAGFGAGNTGWTR